VTAPVNRWLPSGAEADLRGGREAGGSRSVMIVDDHPVFADLLSFSLQAEQDLRCVGRAYTAEEALTLAGREQPDVILLDLQLGDDGHAGLDLIPALLQSVPAARIVILTALKDHYYASLAVNAGAAGYVAKSGSLHSVVTAIRTVCQGRVHIASEVLDALVGYAAWDQVDLAALTDRDKEVLDLMCRGYRAGQIADRLALAPATARTYVSKVIAKLGAHSHLEAVAIALRIGLVRRDDDN
jgi:DNA-binding NarL/FixJ family response regulator